jgi:hypothetical protein
MARLAGGRPLGIFRLDALDLIARAAMAHLHLCKSAECLFAGFGPVEMWFASHFLCSLFWGCKRLNPALFEPSGQPTLYRGDRGNKSPAKRQRKP